MDTLANAFFGERPRAVAYVSVESDTVPGEVTKHYLTFGTLRASHPKLVLLYPTDAAPAGTPHLCVLLGSLKAAHTLLDSLPDYTAAQPGAEDGVSHVPCSARTLKALLTNHKTQGATRCPESYSDDTVLDMFDTLYKPPDILMVSSACTSV